MYEWMPKRAEVCVPGRDDVEALHEMPTPPRSAISWLVPLVSFLAFLGLLVASISLYFLTKWLGKRDAEQRETNAREESRREIATLKQKLETLEVEYGKTLQAARLNESVLKELEFMSPGGGVKRFGGAVHIQQTQLPPDNTQPPLAPDQPEHLPEDDGAKPETQ